MRNPGPSDQQVTSTGWRIVGAPAVSLLSATQTLDAAPSDDLDDVVYAATFRVRPRTGTNALDPLLKALDARLADVRAGSGVVARSSRFIDPPSKFHSIVWQTAGEGDLWIGELSWRRVHPAIPGVALTDHLVIEDRPGDLRLTLRTFSRGGSGGLRGYVGVGQARSPLLVAAASATRLVFEGKSVEPRPLTAMAMNDFIRDVLLDEHRAVPVAVLSATEQGGYYVEPDDLALEMLGVCPVYYLDEHRTSFSLTDGLGDRRLSCFWGALRIFQPDFSCADDGLTHPLLISDRLSDPVVRSGLVGSLALANRSRVPVPPGVDLVTKPFTYPAPPAPPPRVAPPPKPAEVPPDVAAGPPPQQFQSASLEASIRALAEQLGAFQRANVALMDEVVRLRTSSIVRAANTANVDRRLGRLERAILDLAHPKGPSTPAPSPEPEPVVEDEAPEVSLAAVVQQAMEVQADALLILEQAVRSAEESPFEDIDRVAVTLDAMAYIARQRQADAMGQSLRDTFREFGIEYRGGISKATSAKQRKQYVAHLPSGDVICDEHIVIGSSYDPRFCLRIYFTSRAAAEPRFVIAHVGRHFDVASTS